MRAHSTVLLAGLSLLTFPALAAATPHPIAKPDTTIGPIQPTKSPTQPTKSPTKPSTPSTPSSSSSSTQSSTPPPSNPPTGSTGLTPGNGTSANGTNTPATNNTPADPIVPVASEGGRDQSGIAVPAPPPPEPTPLGLVAAGDKVTSPGTSTPAWKIALLALLAATEAFLVVRLVRNRPGDLAPAQ